MLKLYAFMKCRSGATAIEYGLLAAVMGTIVAGLSSTFELGGVFDKIEAQLGTAADGMSGTGTGTGTGGT